VLGDAVPAATGSVVRELRLAWGHLDDAAEDRRHLLSAAALRRDLEQVGLRGLLRCPRGLGAGRATVARRRARVHPRRVVVRTRSSRPHPVRPTVAVGGPTSDAFLRAALPLADQRAPARPRRAQPDPGPRVTMPCANPSTRTGEIRSRPSLPLPIQPPTSSAPRIARRIAMAIGPGGGTHAPVRSSCRSPRSVRAAFPELPAAPQALRAGAAQRGPAGLCVRRLDQARRPARREPGTAGQPLGGQSHLRRAG
jgi:hypothetical protein